MLSQYGEVSARYCLVLPLRPDDAYFVIAHISDVCFSFAACMSRRYRIVVVPCGSCASDDTFQVTADLLHATSTASTYVNDTLYICWSTTAFVLDYYDDLWDDGVRTPLSVLGYEQLFGGLL